MNELNVSEVFVSVQGEGPFLGTKQVFIRLSGCNLSCSYCDTSWSWQIPSKFTITLDDYEETFSNPINTADFAQLIVKNIPQNIFAISVTGGEPLVQSEALLSLLSFFKPHHKVLLETNGTLPENLKMLLPWVDIVSMDVKLPEHCGQNYFKEHLRFLQLANEKQAYVKLIVGENYKVADVMEAAELIATVNKTITLVLQPLAGNTDAKEIPFEELYKLQGNLLNIISDVRIIPQMHKVWGIK